VTSAAFTLGVLGDWRPSLPSWHSVFLLVSVALALACLQEGAQRARGGLLSQILDPVGSAVAFPKSIEFWKDRRIRIYYHTRCEFGNSRPERTGIIIPRARACAAAAARAAPPRARAAGAAA
jgi:hypothetical protein